MFSPIKHGQIIWFYGDYSKDTKKYGFVTDIVDNNIVVARLFDSDTNRHFFVQTLNIYWGKVI